MHRQMGGDMIGMTAMPEARLAREAEMAYAMVAFPTDYDCWRSHDGTNEQGVLEQVIGNLRAGSSMSLSLIRTALSDPAPLAAERSPAHDALQLGIWSDKSRIDPAEVERLRPLWARYF
jgi:5'-methylthioadenosine phosphorylase